MRQYLIAGIKLNFSYQYDEYFKNNIEKYEIQNQKEPEYNLIVKTVETIQEPKAELLFKFKSRSVFQDKENKFIVAYHEDDSIKLLMKHSLDYKNYEILLTPVYGDRLSEMEYVFSGLAFMGIALKENRLSLHASAIEVNNKAILFSASSGGGKTTHVKNWEKIGVNLKIINDDKPLIYKKDGLYYVAGSPWSGKEILNNNIEVPLHAIVFLEQAEENHIETLDKKQALTELLKNTHRPEEPELYIETLKIIEELIEATILFKLEATKDASSALFLYNILL